MFFSVHKIEGDPADLLSKKRTKMDPAIAKLAKGMGAIFSVTVVESNAIVTYNLWESQEAASKFSQLPEARNAQMASGLPKPSSFNQYATEDVFFYKDIKVD